MRGTKGVIHNLSILTTGQVASQLLNVWALVFLAEHLGAHWFGVVQIGVSVMAYALITAEWGMMSLGIREVSRLDNLSAIQVYARTHMGILSLQALVVAGAAFFFLPRLAFFHEDPFIFFAYVLTVFPQIFMLSWVALGMERMAWVSAAKTGRSLFYALFILLLWKPLGIWTGLPPQHLVPILLILAMILGNLVIAIPLANLFGAPLIPSWPTLAETWRRWQQTAPLGSAILILRILLNIDIIMLGLRATATEAGVYAAASRIIFLIVIIVEVLWSALLPRFSRLFKNDPVKFNTSFNLYLGFVLAGLLPVALGGVLLGTDLIQFIYKGQFPQAGAVFRVLSVSYTLLAVGTFLGNTLISEDRQKSYLPPVICSALVAILATYFLIPQAGGFGASLGMLASHLLLLVLLAITLRKRFHHLLGQTLLLMVPALSFMALVVWLADPIHVVGRVILGAMAYGFLVAWPLLRFRKLVPLATVKVPERYS